MSEFDHKAFLKTLTTRPGVYQMYDGQGKLLYVGKARNLKNRVGVPGDPIKPHRQTKNHFCG